MENLFLVKEERARRHALWASLKEQSNSGSVSPKLINKLRLHRGQSGVFRDRGITVRVAENKSGVAVGVLHTGSHYADDLTADGVIYHYPKTDRGTRDDNEISALKLCGDLELPLFVITTLKKGAPLRAVKLGWVADYDDLAGQILILFSEETIPLRNKSPREPDMGPFLLKAPRQFGLSKSKTRPNQVIFHFEVARRYGEVCAVCDLAHPELLHAAHICPVEQSGTDDPRNGIVLCVTHHRAFDLCLFGIEPETLKLRILARLQSPTTIGIKRKEISHLAQLPHHDALLWAWRRFEKNRKKTER
jgi:putative restriction endonuclease